MKTLNLIVFFLLLVVASVANAQGMDLQVVDAKCVRLVNAPAAVTKVKFKSGGKRWATRLPGKCYDPKWVNGTATVKVRLFGENGRKLGTFQKTVTKPFSAPKVETVDQMLARAQRKLVQCDEKLAKCETSRTASVPKSGKAWWQVRKNCASAFAKKKGLTRWNSVGKHCACETGFGWVGSKKTGKCGRGGLPLVPGKVPAGVAAKSLEDLFGRVERLEKDMVEVKADVTVLKEGLAKEQDFRVLQDMVIKKVEKRVEALEQAPSSSGNWGTWPVGLKVATDGICVLGTKGNFCYQSFMPKLVLRAPFFKGTKLEITGGVGVATDYGQASKSFVAAGGLTFHVKTWLGLGLGYEYVAYNLNPNTESARNGQSQVGVAEVTFKPWWFFGIKLGVGVGSRTLNHGSANTAIAILRLGLELYAF